MTSIDVKLSIFLEGSEFVVGGDILKTLNHIHLLVSFFGDQWYRFSVAPKFCHKSS